MWGSCVGAAGGGDSLGAPPLNGGDERSRAADVAPACLSRLAVGGRGVVGRLANRTGPLESLQ